MGKHPKFMIAKNPMADPNGVYIYHSQRPRFLAKAVKVENSSFEVVDDIDKMLDYYQGNAEKVQGLFRAMEKWYIAYKVHKKNG